MSMEASMNSSSAQNESVKTESSQMDMVVIAKRQRFQDIVFHRLTQTFSLLVLLALTGIIASLFINAWPAFQKFGINFIWRVEWDIVNEEFGAAISIVGTLASAGIAMLIAVPLAFGIALLEGREFPTDADRCTQPSSARSSRSWQCLQLSLTCGQFLHESLRAQVQPVGQPPDVVQAQVAFATFYRTHIVGM